jgi:hypothetical protein
MVHRLREYVNGAWTAVVRLDSTYMAPQEGPRLAAAPNGDVFVAYSLYDEGTSIKHVFVKTRHNGTWGQPVKVTAAFGSDQFTRYTLEVNPITNNPHVVFEGWTEVPAGESLVTVNTVYHTFRNSSGVWLTTPEAISEPHDAQFRHHYPAMAFVASGAAHVVWYDTVPPAGSGMMYRYCPSEGGAWSTPEWFSLYRLTPYIAADAARNAVRVVWSNHLDNPYRDQIWWKSNYLGGGGSQAESMAMPQSGIELFPNPATAGRVTVRYSLPRAEALTVTLLDVAGRALKTQEVAAGMRGALSVDVSGLSAGVYVARLAAGDWTASRSLILQR